MIEDAIRSVLLADASVAALLGLEPRVYPLVMPQKGKLPAIVYQRISTVGAYHLEGRATPSTARVQLSLMSASFTEVRQLAAAARSALDAYSGIVGTYLVNFVEVLNMLDEFHSETGICRVVMDVRIQSNEGA